MQLCHALTFGIALLATGCATVTPASELPPAGQPTRDVNILEERSSGPIVLLFPGRSAPVDDVNLGILQTAWMIADGIDGSLGLFNVHSYDAAHRWVEGQARLRREAGAPRRLALVGHSWGGAAAGRFLQELLAADVIDELSLLVTIDAIEPGYLWGFFAHFPSVVTLESVFPHRFRLLAMTDFPVPDGRRFRQHINYYQMDSPHLSGDAVPTATQNHEVWFDGGTELGHGNLDNYISALVAQDVIRAMKERQR